MNPSIFAQSQDPRQAYNGMCASAGAIGGMQCSNRQLPQSFFDNARSILTTYPKVIVEEDGQDVTYTVKRVRLLQLVIGLTLELNLDSEYEVTYGGIFGFFQRTRRHSESHCTRVVATPDASQLCGYSLRGDLIDAEGRYLPQSAAQRMIAAWLQWGNEIKDCRPNSKEEPAPPYTEKEVLPDASHEKRAALLVDKPPKNEVPSMEERAEMNGATLLQKVTDLTSQVRLLEKERNVWNEAFHELVATLRECGHDDRDIATAPSFDLAKLLRGVRLTRATPPADEKCPPEHNQETSPCA